MLSHFCIAVLMLVTSATAVNKSTNGHEVKLGIAADDPRIVNREDVCPPACPSDCLDLYNDGYIANGVFTVYLSTDSMRPLQVYCDMQTSPGGWLVFQRRAMGTLDFNRTWDEYERGFGALLTEFWFGNNDLNMLLAEKGSYRLRINLRNAAENEAYAQYTYFGVGHKTSKYSLGLSCGSYSGTAGDSLMPHTSVKYSTYDFDNDANADNCASIHGGGWWYHATCFNSNLNGVFGSPSFVWNTWNASPLTYTGMSFRPM